MIMKTISVQRTVLPSGEVEEYEYGMVVVKERIAPPTKEFNKMWNQVYKLNNPKVKKVK